MTLCPEGTGNYWETVRRAIANSDNELINDLRQYQLHQYLDESYELRLVALNRLPEKFDSWILSAWQKDEQVDGTSAFNYLQEMV